MYAVSLSSFVFLKDDKVWPDIKVTANSRQLIRAEKSLI